MNQYRERIELALAENERAIGDLRRYAADVESLRTALSDTLAELLTASANMQRLVARMAEESKTDDEPNC